jgi:hypothetical protein
VNDACYAASVDKIFGAVGPYVCKYNAITGSREGFVRVASPLYGEIRLCYHAANDTIYAAAWNEPNQQFFAPFTWPQRDVFPVSTALVSGAGLGLGTIYTTQAPYNGFRWISSAGNYLYLSVGGIGFGIVKINPTNLVDRNSTTASALFQAEQCGISPTQIVNPQAAFVSQFRFAPIGFNLNADWTASSVSPYLPIAAEYCAQNGLFYMVCGDTNLLRINVLSPINFTALNLGPVEATANPCRIRYRALDQKLYMPCMSAGVVIVWDPASETGIAKSGFENVVDICFSPSKAWAVMNAPIGLKEITP